MIYANKKISKSASLAQQTAQIITNITALESKNLVRFDNLTVYLHMSLWPDKRVAMNWIDCLLIYYKIKRGLKTGNIYFKDIESEELIGTCIDKKAKVLRFQE